MVGDRHTAREWLVVVAVGVGGVALAALLVFAPWTAAAPQPGERVVRVELGHPSRAGHIAAARDPR